MSHERTRPDTTLCERAFRRLVGKDPALQPQIETTLERLAADTNDPRLKTHHLSGHLKGLYASSDDSHPRFRVRLPGTWIGLRLGAS